MAVLSPITVTVRVRDVSAEVENYRASLGVFERASALLSEAETRLNVARGIHADAQRLLAACERSLIEAVTS